MAVAAMAPLALLGVFRTVSYQMIKVLGAVSSTAARGLVSKTADIHWGKLAHARYLAHEGMWPEDGGAQSLSYHRMAPYASWEWWIDADLYNSTNDCLGEPAELRELAWGHCHSIDFNVTSWRLRPHFDPRLFMLPNENCAMHLFEDENCRGAVVGVDLHMNVYEDLFVCRGAPYTILNQESPSFRSMRAECCPQPFCEVPNPDTCKWEEYARDPDNFAALRDQGLIPAGYPPPPPPSYSFGNCTSEWSRGPRWFEGLMRAFALPGRHMPEGRPSPFDPVWTTWYEDWVGNFGKADETHAKRANDKWWESDTYKAPIEELKRKYWALAEQGRNASLPHHNATVQEIGGPQANSTATQQQELDHQEEDDIQAVPDTTESPPSSRMLTVVKTSCTTQFLARSLSMK